jgi:hypothetical protein
MRKRKEENTRLLNPVKYFLTPPKFAAGSVQRGLLEIETSILSGIALGLIRPKKVWSTSKSERPCRTAPIFPPYRSPEMENCVGEKASKRNASLDPYKQAE